jgi:hypothetical protein
MKRHLGSTKFELFNGQLRNLGTQSLGCRRKTPQLEGEVSFIAPLG